METNKGGIILPSTGIIDLNGKKMTLENKETSHQVKSYKDNRIKALSAPTPGIEVLHNNVLVRAVGPYIKTKQNGIIVNKLFLSPQLESIFDDMSYPVDDVQEILLIGDYVSSNKESKVRPGMYAKIDFGRFKTVRNGKNMGHTDVFYNIPVESFDGHDYMLIDMRDIRYVMYAESVPVNFKEQD